MQKTDFDICIYTHKKSDRCFRQSLGPLKILSRCVIAKVTPGPKCSNDAIVTHVAPQPLSLREERSTLCIVSENDWHLKYILMRMLSHHL